MQLSTLALVAPWVTLSRLELKCQTDFLGTCQSDTTRNGLFGYVLNRHDADRMVTNPGPIPEPIPDQSRDSFLLASEHGPFLLAPCGIEQCFVERAQLDSNKL